MPSAALRYCTAPGCGVLVPSGRCAAHQTARYRAIERQRGTATARGYGADWQAVRARVLATAPLCRLCEARGQWVRATDVDHITPLAQGGARLDISNLQPLCRQCHQEKTAAENAARNG